MSYSDEDVTLGCRGLRLLRRTRHKLPASLDRRPHITRPFPLGYRCCHVVPGAGPSAGGVASLCGSFMNSYCYGVFPESFCDITKAAQTKQDPASSFCWEHVYRHWRVSCLLTPDQSSLQFGGNEASDLVIAMGSLLPAWTPIRARS